MAQRNRRILENICALGIQAVMVALFFSILLMPEICFSQDTKDPRKEINYPGDSSDVMWFIHITDTHITNQPVDTSKSYGNGIKSPEQKNLYWIVNDAFETIKPSFIINTGDLTDALFPHNIIDQGKWIADNSIFKQDIHQWDIYYWIVNNSLANYENSYYDIPGNHDRYSDPWDGNGDNGYLHKSIMGRKYDPNLNVIGQFPWGDKIHGGKYFFYGLNTCDETGTPFIQYAFNSYASGRFDLSQLGPSDYPQLTDKEIEDMIEGFRKVGKSKLAFLFGHAGFYTTDANITAIDNYFSSNSIDRLPGLYDDRGYIIGKVSKYAPPERIGNYLSPPSTIELVDMSYFPDEKKGQLFQLNKQNPIVYEMKWEYANQNILYNVEWIGEEPLEVFENSPIKIDMHDRGLGKLIQVMDENNVSAYIYGHTHENKVFFDVDPKYTPVSTMLINTAALKDGNYRIIAVDNGGISTVTAQVSKFPVVLITAPVNKKLGGTNPYSYSIPQAKSPIRALAFCNPPEDVVGDIIEYHADVQYVIDDNVITGDMHRISEDEDSPNYNLWEGIWDTSKDVRPGEHKISVVVKCLKTASSGVDTLSSSSSDSIWVDVKEDLGTFNIDTALIIDSSESMAYNDHKNNRLEAARFFIDSAEDNDFIAVIDFDDSVHIDPDKGSIRLVRDNRVKLKEAVNKIDSLGSTNISAALKAGYAQLALSTTNSQKVAILLTDGKENETSDQKNENGSYNNEAADYQKKGWRIFTIGLSDQVNEPLLKKIAADSGGEYFKITTKDAAKNAITQIYQKISRTIHKGGQTILQKDVNIFQGQVDENIFEVLPGIKSLSVDRLIPGSDVELVLIQPDGKVIDRNTNDPNVYHSLSATYEIYRVNNPMPGKWKTKLRGIDTLPDGEPTTLTVSVTIPNSAAVNPDQTALHEQTVYEDSVVTLDGTKSVYSGKIIASYQWTQVSNTPDWVAKPKLSDPKSPTQTFTAPQVGKDNGTLTFQLALTDITGMRYIDTYTVKILNIDSGLDDGEEGGLCFISSAGELPDGKSFWLLMGMFAVFVCIARKTQRNHQS